MAEKAKYLDLDGTTELVGKLRALVDGKQDALKHYSESGDVAMLFGITTISKEYRSGGDDVVNVDTLGTIGNLGRIGTLTTLGTLGNLQTLTRLEYLGSLGNLNTLDTLTRLEYLGSLGTLGNLGTLDTLGTLTRLEYLGSLGNLNTLTSMKWLMELDQLYKLNFLRTLTMLGTIGRIGTKSPGVTRVHSLAMTAADDAYVVDEEERGREIVQDYLLNGLWEGDIVLGRTGTVIGLYEVGTMESEDPYVWFIQRKENILG